MSSVQRQKMTKETAELPDDPRLMQAVEEYLKQLETGQLPNRQEILRVIPIFPGLTQCLDGLEFGPQPLTRWAHRLETLGARLPGQPAD